MSVTLTKIPNPFQPEINIIEVLDYIEGKRLDQYLVDIPLDDKDITFIIAINGKIINEPYHLVDVFDEDIISACAKTEFTVAGLVAGAVAGAVAGTSFGMMFVYMAVYAVVYVATLFAISYGMNALASALGPDAPSSGSGDTQVDQTFGWGTLQQSQSEGLNIPYVYGTVKMAGHVLNQFVDIDNNKETLNVLLGLCDHQIDSISDVRINDQPYTYYKDTTVFTDQLGSLSDTAIEGFHEVVGQNNVGSKLAPGSAIIQQTDGNAVEKLKIFVTASRGLYYTNDSGSLDSRSAEYGIEYKLAADSSYTFHSDNILSGATTETQRDVVTIDDLTPGQYDVKVTRLNAEEASFKGKSDIYFSSLQEIVKKELTYPGIAKYAVKALATDQLSGGMPAFSCLASKNTVSIFDYDLITPAWADKRATNPAWIVYSMLVTYAKIDKDRLIWEDFSGWADYCDETVDSAYRFIINTVIFSGNFWDQIQRIAKLGHAAIIRRGVRYGIFLDKEDNIISHLFTMGNIKADSFNIQYLPKKDRANAVEIEYTDPDKDNTRQVITVHSDDYITSDSISQKATVSISAAISQKQAIREGVFRINSNKYLNRVITFDAMWDSFGCITGDLFNFQHEVVNYEGSDTGGLTITAGNDDGSGNPFVQIDKEVEIEIESGNPYRIMVRIVNASGEEEFVEKIVSNAIGTADILTITEPWTTVPDNNALYLFGTATTYTKPYRITAIDRKDDLTRTIMGLEYIPEIFTENSAHVIEEPAWEIHKQTALQVQLNEFLTYTHDGSYKSNINVSWHSGFAPTGSNWAIWLEDTTAGTDPVKLNNSYETSYTIISNLIIGNTYKIYVAVAGEGATDTGDNTNTITILGQLAPPAAVLNFNGIWDSIKRQVHFTWSANSEIDMHHYEIRQGSTWVGGTTVAEPISNFTSIFIDEGFADTLTYRIKAIDNSGIESSEATCMVSIDTSDCALSTPGDLSISNISVITSDGRNIIMLLATWNGDSEISDDWHHYELQMEDIAVGKFSRFATTDREFQWEVMPNREYGVAVRAIDVSGNNTAWTTQETLVTTKDSEAPATPTWPVSDYAIAGFKVIGLSWNNNSEYDLSHYVIERSTSPTFSSGNISLGNILASFHSDSFDMDVLTTYYYRIKAVDTSGNSSGYSVIKSAATLEIGTTDIAADAIIADHISVDNLAAINANLGTITAGRIQNTTDTTYLDLTNDLMSLGGKLTWNGVDLAVNGQITVTGTSTGYSSFTDKPTSLNDISTDEYDSFQESIAELLYTSDPNEAVNINTDINGADEWLFNISDLLSKGALVHIEYEGTDDLKFAINETVLEEPSTDLTVEADYGGLIQTSSFSNESDAVQYVDLSLQQGSGEFDYGGVT